MVCEELSRKKKETAVEEERRKQMPEKQRKDVHVPEVKVVVVCSMNVNVTKALRK